MIQSIGGAMVLAMIQKAIEEKKKEEAKEKEQAKATVTEEAGAGE